MLSMIGPYLIFKYSNDADYYHYNRGFLMRKGKGKTVLITGPNKKVQTV